jgi:hypothetical protein
MTEEKKDSPDELSASESKAQASAHIAESWLADFFTFRMFITRPFIKIIYALGALACIVFGLWSMFSSPYGNVSSGGSVINGLLWIIIGNLVWRIICESAIIFFRMHDVLKSIDYSLKEE